MPKRRRAWASWNFLRWQREGAPLNDVAVTYWMNNLQGIDHDKPLFVSLNPPFAPDPDLTFGRYLCEHPQYDAKAFAAQKRLGAIGYAPNTVYLHRDERLMPKRKRAWASWNFLRWQREGTAVNDVAVTYWMNRLQGIDDDKPLFVSLNPPFEPDAALTFGKYMCEHPQFNAAAFAAQKRLGEIQGRRHTWFCGAWTGYGFHEDGLRSGLEVAEALGASAPWRELPAELAEAAE